MKLYQVMAKSYTSKKIEIYATGKKSYCIAMKNYFESFFKGKKSFKVVRIKEIKP